MHLLSIADVSLSCSGHRKVHRRRTQHELQRYRSTDSSIPLNMLEEQHTPLGSTLHVAKKFQFLESAVQYQIPYIVQAHQKVIQQVLLVK